MTFLEPTKRGFRDGVKESVLEILSPNWVKQQNAPPIQPASSTPRRRRAAVYMRYSTDAQDDYSFERQRNNAQEYADKIGVDIVAIFGDAGESGAFTANRVEYQDLFAAAERQEFEVVITEDGDRFGRKLHLITAGFSALAELGIELHSTKLGKWSLMHAAFAGLMSDAQRTRIFELTRSGIIKILDKNLWPGSAPFGYSKIPGKPGEMKINPKEQAVVKRIYAMRMSGLSVHSIHTILQKENVPSRHGNWRLKTIQYILSNPMYVGVLIFFRTKYKKIQTNLTTIVTTITKRSPAEWHYGERSDWKIVDLDVWQAVQAMSSLGQPRGPRPKFLLSGRIFCGSCGRRMHVGTYSGGIRYFNCSTQWAIKHNGLKTKPCKEHIVPVAMLEKAAIGLVTRKLGSPDALKMMQSAYEAKISVKSREFGADRTTLQKERADICARLDATLDEAITVGLSTKVLAEQRQSLCTRMEEIDQRIAGLPHMMLSAIPILETPSEAAAFLDGLKPGMNFRNCGEGAARVLAVFQALVEKIMVRTDFKAKLVTIEIKGPIAFADEGGASDSFNILRKQGHLDRLSKAVSKLESLALSDDDWAKLSGQLPCDPIWVDGFEQPISLRTVVNALIFRRRTGVGKHSLPDAFGPKRQILWAAQHLTYGGILDAVNAIVKKENIEVALGLDLNLDSGRSPFISWEAHRQRNQVRKKRIFRDLQERASIS